MRYPDIRSKREKRHLPKSGDTLRLGNNIHAKRGV
jgi:hypothetical protein